MVALAINPIDVGQYIINSFIKKNESITTLKLMKLVFYSQVWSLVWDDKPLFEEDFEAWVNGPVAVSLFHSLQDFYYCPNEIKGADVSKFTDNQKDTIDRVLSYYGDYTSSELVALTHSEDPWLLARKGLPDGTPCKNTITKDSIANFYITQCR